jgi:signal transduction histidine kinase
MQQLEMTKVVSEGISFFLDHLVKDMDFLTSHPKLKADNIELKELIDNFRVSYDQTIISTIIFADSSANIIYSTGKESPRWMRKKLNELLTEFQNKFTINKFLTSEVLPEKLDDTNSEKSFLIVLPLKKNFNEKKSFIVYLVNFNSLIKHFILPLKLSSNDFIWILDGNGRLIYHPKHEEMLFNSIFETNSECQSCHTSFDTQLKILKSTEPAYGEYWVQGDEPSKIFAYVPINIGNQKWFIAISTLLTDVTAKIRDKFQSFFILGIIILVTMFSFIFIIYFLNLKRIKSEEARKNLEKIQEYQEQLNHSARLASIGELVDSVAHEINTPMGIISAHADSILLQDEKTNVHKEELEIIKKQTKRVSEYTKSLLNFSKRIAFNPEKVDVKDLINESVYLLQPRFREKKIQIIKDIPAEEMIIIGDKRQLEQVLINIFNNAIDSFSAEGKIIIKIKEINILQDKISHNQLTECVSIIITDNGTGIIKDNLAKIFDPFYSTKEKNGTGLGLSIAKSIIQRHKGNIEVTSEVGKGTTFTLVIPKKLKSE